MNNKIIVLGASGMAGHVIYNFLKSTNKYELLGVTHNSKIDASNIVLDVRNFEALEVLISNEKPNVIINAIGVLIGGAKKSVSNAILLNSYLPHFLSDVCRKIDSKLIHISTDCVFSGHTGAYIESSFKDADDIYGRSKSLGEINNPKDLTIRTSIIGPELKSNGEGLFQWFMKSSGIVSGFSNAFWSGVTTFELAKAIEVGIVDRNVGLVHLTNNLKISKYELLLLFKEIWNRDDIVINKDERVSKDKSFLDTQNVLKIKIPEYREMLQNMHDEMKRSMNYNNIH